MIEQCCNHPEHVDMQVHATKSIGRAVHQGCYD